MVLRRGFKSEAERIASGIRDELGLRETSQIKPEAIAEHLGVEIIAGDALLPRKRFKELDEIQPGAFSACTFRPSPDRTVVVFNPLATSVRRVSDLAHEFAHLLLEHHLARVETIGEVTFLSCDADQEDEAAWLAGCLLLPRALLLREVKRGASAPDIAAKYGVSAELARFRVNVTGVLRQARGRPAS